ncbi:hypothetical protein AGOR_G00152570 [Albula goreensis]|uniref:Uncharacterized protein n=1 Tax=Albula goreensis TaxID=1534307 RepID=A0A8T3D6U4_9TELE|nr:hypothetical protein AGOR_G00152570 [Albula goreensis]
MRNVLGLSIGAREYSEMCESCLLFSLVSLILSSGIPVHGYLHHIEHNPDWASQWLSFGSHSQQGEPVPSVDHSDHMFLDNTAQTKLDAEVQCGVKNMILQVARLGPSPLQVGQNDSWVSVYELPPSCGFMLTRRRRLAKRATDPCQFSKPDPGTIPVRMTVPLVVPCPVSAPATTVACSTELMINLGGVSLDELKIKVYNTWLPLMTACRLCGMTVAASPGAVSLKAPLTPGYCVMAKDAQAPIWLMPAKGPSFEQQQSGVKGR